MQRQQATFAGQWAVSILVFVELALDEGLLGGRRTLSMVSILVFVELALDESCLRVMRKSYLMFQSLFSWNLLLMVKIMSKLDDGSLGFNPCFRGTCS